MNIKDAYNAAVRLQANIVKNKLVQASLQAGSRNTPKQWNSEFIRLFEDLDFEERKLLREIGQYQKLLEVYDIAKEDQGQVSVFVVQNASEALGRVNAYVQANAPFAKGGENHGAQDSVEITFPIASLKSTTFELSEEIDWFFKLFNRVSAEFSDEEKPTIISVDNVDLSIAVAIDWKFLLVILLIWTRFQKYMKDSQEIKSAISTLIQKGLDDKKADELEKELEKQSDQIIDEVIKEYEKIAGQQSKAGWQSSFTQFAHHLFKAKDRGYRLEFMAGRDSNGALLAGRPPAFVEAVRELSYTRENDWGGAGRTELLSKPKATSDGT
ncbi:hypothetical protein LB559_02960 [Mesorhizobium sp. BR1-1-3]|uniref:hypothetical protein n=3 Tax=Mesorhizobium TaxID=68287 RepID=UPI000FC9FF67|nr:MULTISPECIES: hypothetical protein [unclassified Mesorhizobium]MBZ9886905.1 hypothetical protein [Mesorhizobium sp. BR1-1-3]RUY31684.1 hypothetical protein EN979_02000 [Mesorhizobium sp. M7A.F.Ca.US.001.04.2.1]RUY44128.1 hypothetical protein EN978_07280 [Mesorhizobium sp. M7A.F.Ca.US.001.04.1.1]RVA13684.1 hypothetical protein EN932_07790 [Mesorhizobium sp. M7A.F.Ca.US.002.01.1.1]